MNTTDRRMLQKGYEEGVLWPIFEEGHLLSCYLLGYLACFSESALYCPYIPAPAIAIFRLGF